jgi:predicted RNA binding protein YcfA (HicA-like mRNA interferase family)
MTKFPADAPIRKVIEALDRLGFRLVRDGNHISMIRENPDGTKTPMTIPNHQTIKKSTLRTILTQSGISREAFLLAYEE